MATDLAEKTIKNYLRTLPKINEYLIKEEIIPSSLEKINSAEELERIKIDYFRDSENKTTDKKSHGQYSAAFSKFIEYKDVEGNKLIKKEGIIYILSNPAMPGLVKIGKTINLEERLKSLYSSGVPLPFRCVYAVKVKNYSQIEKLMHNGLDDHRENANREFFRISEDNAISVLQISGGEDVTPRDDAFEDEVDKLAFEKSTKIGQKFNFELVNIPIGSKLSFVKDDELKCEVISKNKIRFEGKEHSLSSAGLLVVNRMGYNWKSLAGPNFWKYEGEVLKEIRDKLEDAEN